MVVLLGVVSINGVTGIVAGGGDIISVVESCEVDMVFVPFDAIICSNGCILNDINNREGEGREKSFFSTLSSVWSFDWSCNITYCTSMGHTRNRD